MLSWSSCILRIAAFNEFLAPFVGVEKLILLDDVRQLFHMADER